MPKPKIVISKTESPIWELYEELRDAVDRDMVGDIEYALEKGANPNLIQHHEHSPVFNVIVHGGKPSALDMLWVAGAKLNRKDWDYLAMLPKDKAAALDFHSHANAERYYKLAQGITEATPDTLWQEHGINFDLSAHRANLERLQPELDLYHGKLLIDRSSEASRTD